MWFRYVPPTSSYTTLTIIMTKPLDSNRRENVRIESDDIFKFLESLTWSKKNYEEQE